MTRLDELGRQLAREQDALRARSQVRAQVAARMQRVPAPVAPRASHRRARVAWAGALMAACAVSAVAWWQGQGAAPLSVHLGSGEAPVPLDTWIQAPEEASVPLRFSDGTRIEIAARSRARLVGIGAQGAQLLLESGHLRADVVSRPGASWRLHAGPFTVRVIGTRFDVRWHPEGDRFELELQEGSVEVSGCVFGAGYRMRAGQSLRAACDAGRFDVTSGPLSPEPDRPADALLPDAAEPDTPSPAAGRPAPAEPDVFTRDVPIGVTDAEDAPGPSASVPIGVTDAEDAPGPSASVPIGVTDAEDAPGPSASLREAERRGGSGETATSAPRTQPGEPGGPNDIAATPADGFWRALVARGDYVRAWAAVQAAGVRPVSRRASADELLLLAEAARYAADAEVEGQLLRLLRRRFAGTRQAALAAFALGRLAFDRHAAYERAAAWFRAYLKEQPGGALAREAAGRLMEAQLRAGALEEARALAKEYLASYPTGPHAGLARGLR